MENQSLEANVDYVTSTISSNEREYLNSILDEARKEGYSCVSGCSSCVSCGGND